MKKKPEPKAARARCKRHPKLIRIDSCTERCPACHWYSAMIATKRGVRRKWVRELGDATKAGKRATRHLLAIARASVGVAAAEYVRALPVPRSEAVDVLDELADAIKRNVFGGMENVQVGLAPGFTVNMGQQYKVVVRVLEDRDDQFPSYTDILVRTYVPSAGYPVVIDAFGEEKARCFSRAELEAELKKLLKHPDLRLRLESLKTLARARRRPIDRKRESHDRSDV